MSWLPGAGENAEIVMDWNGSMIVSTAPAPRTRLEMVRARRSREQSNVTLPLTVSVPTVPVLS